MSERYRKGNNEDFCNCGKSDDIGGKCDCDSCRRRKSSRDRDRGENSSYCDCDSCRRKHDRDVAGGRDRHERFPCEWERVDHERERHYAKEGRPWVKFSWERNCECWGCVQNRQHNR